MCEARRVVIKLALALALVACSSKSDPSRQEHSPEVTAPMLPKPPPPMVYGDGPPPAPPQSEEVEAALRSLSSEHASDVPPLAWWKVHAAEVRPVLTAWLADNADNGTSDHRAIQLLGDLGEAGDVEILGHVLTTWTGETARAAAASALGIHASPGATKVLIDATKVDDPAVVGHAASGLGSRKGDADARTRLDQLRDHPDADVRSRAAKALREHGAAGER